MTGTLHADEADAPERLVGPRPHASGAAPSLLTVAGTQTAPETRRPPVSPAQLVSMQRLAGNRAVVHSLQRQAPASLLEESEETLTSEPAPEASPEASSSPTSDGAPPPAAPDAPGGGTLSGAGASTPGPMSEPEPAVSIPAPEANQSGPEVPASFEPASPGTGPSTSGPSAPAEPTPDQEPAPQETPAGPAGPSMDGSSGGGGGGGGTDGSGGAGGAPGAGSTAPSPPFDFGSWVVDHGNAIRTPLEFGRLIPGLGLYSGLAADSIQFAQDVDAVPGKLSDHPIFSAFLLVRNGVNVLNGAVGHVVYVNELVQDGLAGSVIGAPFIPVSAAAHQVFALVKAYNSTVLVFLDTGLMVGAAYNADKNPEQHTAWAALADGYAANAIGSTVSWVLDVIALASAGVSQTGIVSANQGALKALWAFIKEASKHIFDWAQKLWNVWGGDVLGSGHEAGPQPAGQPAVQRLAAGGDSDADDGSGTGAIGAGDLAGLAAVPVLLAQAANLRTTSAAGRVAWAGVDAELGLASATAAQSLANMDAISAELFDGKSSFQVIQEATDTALASMEDRIAALQQFQATARDGKANADAVRTGAADVLAEVDALTVPDVEIPRTELGDGALADLAESVVDTGAGVVNSGLELAVAGVRSAVDTAKGAVTAPVETVRDNATEVGDFLALAAEMTDSQIAQVQAFVGGLRAAMAQTTGFESAMDAIIGQVAQLTGAPAFKIQDLRDVWASVPAVFDDIDSLADRLERRAATLMAAGAGGGGEDRGGPDVQMSAAEPPDDGDGDTAG